MARRVCLAGATGWAGAALARAIAASSDLVLAAGVSRRHAGQNLGEVLKLPDLNCPLYATADAALTMGCDVFMEYTRPDVARANVAAAVAHGAHVVIGTSGLSDDDLAGLGRLASERGVAVLAVGNFSLANLVLQKCAELAAHHMPQWEIVDYASAGKPDAPSGTVRELAYRLAQVRSPKLDVPLEQVQGPQEARGATMNGIQVHSIRLPGYVISAEVIFGAMDEKLTLRYDSGSGPEAYVEGALIALRRVGGFVGLRRGLDTVIEL